MSIARLNVIVKLKKLQREKPCLLEQFMMQH